MARKKEHPHTSWITKSIREGDWLRHQVQKYGRDGFENAYWNYIDGNMDVSVITYSTAKEALRKIERNWRTKQSRQGKKNITINAESKKRIEKHKRKTGKSTIEIIDELTLLLESSHNLRALTPLDH